MFQSLRAKQPCTNFRSIFRVSEKIRTETADMSSTSQTLNIYNTWAEKAKHKVRMEVFWLFTELKKRADMGFAHGPLRDFEQRLYAISSSFFGFFENKLEQSRQT